MMPSGSARKPERRAEEAKRQAGAVGDVYGKCCLKEADHPFYSPVIQERAWTSPIWIRPAANGS